MKVIIAGSRTITNIALVNHAMLGINPSEIVSGGARGVDLLGEQWAKQHNIPVFRMPALWEQEGKSAGFRRNERMAQYADQLVAIWDGHSRGTLHMINCMKQKNKPVFILNLGDHHEIFIRIYINTNRINSNILLLGI